MSDHAPDPFDIHAHLADVLDHQSRLNTDMANTLHLMYRDNEATRADLQALRDTDRVLGLEIAAMVDRIVSLTATVGRLMTIVEPPPDEHSVRVGPAGASAWSSCSTCGHAMHQHFRGGCNDCECPGMHVDGIQVPEFAS